MYTQIYIFMKIVLPIKSSVGQYFLTLPTPTNHTLLSPAPTFMTSHPFPLSLSLSYPPIPSFLHNYMFVHMYVFVYKNKHQTMFHIHVFIYMCLYI